MEKKRKLSKEVIALIICIIAFIIMTILVETGCTVEFDNTVSHFIQTTMPVGANKVLEVITEIGGTSILPICVIIVSIILLLFKKVRYAIIIFINALFSTILYSVIKHIIQRPRPYPFYFIDESGYSFPSGHSTSNMAIFALLIYFVCKKIKNEPLKIILSVILAMWILLIGVTRIYFNVHYPSDVISGYILGVICVLTVVIVQKNFKKVEK